MNARQPDDEPNAWVTNDAGRVVRRPALGDGLSDVRVSPRGKIWTAYFDEGVFGGGAGAAGLVARDGAGRKVWAYDARKAGTDDIADVYAFNLAAEDDAWVYFYQPFVIVRWQRQRSPADRLVEPASDGLGQLVAPLKASWASNPAPSRLEMGAWREGRR